jgi:hypothetical protein
MDGCDHSDSVLPPAEPAQAADVGRRSPEAMGRAPYGQRSEDTAFHESNNGDSDGKSRCAAPWPFLIRRLG